uniref:Integrase catalytic domain-containing protein n=1 Tax=Fagus sylvatica TaxID=28930 RepID=A0A2N9FM26_FAGSY
MKVKSPREVKIGTRCTTEQKEALIALLREFHEIFAWSYQDMPGLDTDIVVHKIPLKPECKPVKQALRRMKPEVILKIKEEVEKQLKAGFLSTQRMPCSHSWTDSQGTIRSKWPKKTNPRLLSSHIGEPLVYDVMPFGLKNAGATYQRAMVTLFHDMIHHEIEVYVDDMIAKSRTTQDHLTDLRKLFQRLKKGIEIDPTKVQAIRSMPAPKTEKEIRSFLGRINYIARFIAQLTATCEPLFKLLRKDVKIKWTEDCQKAFDKIKEYLLNPPILVPPTPGCPLILYLTVQEASMGCMLGQQDETEEERSKQSTISARSSQSRRPATCLPALTGKIARWQVLLSEFDILFVAQKAIKGQAIADLLGRLPVRAVRTDGLRIPRRRWTTSDMSRRATNARCIRTSKNAPPQYLHTMASPWPFSAWGMDVIGAITPKASNGHEFILVAIDYFTKWVEACSFKNVTQVAVTRFVKNNIICRYEMPEMLITDNASNLNNPHDGPAMPTVQDPAPQLCSIPSEDERSRHLLGPPPIPWYTRMEAVLPVEVEIPSLRILSQTQLEEAEWAQARYKQLNFIDEKRLGGTVPQDSSTRDGSKELTTRRLDLAPFQPGDLVLKKRNTALSDSRGKFAPSYEGLSAESPQGSGKGRIPLIVLLQDGVSPNTQRIHHLVSAKVCLQMILSCLGDLKLLANEVIHRSESGDIPSLSLQVTTKVRHPLHCYDARYYRMDSKRAADSSLSDALTRRRDANSTRVSSSFLSRSTIFLDWLAEAEARREGGTEECDTPGHTVGLRVKKGLHHFLHSAKPRVTELDVIECHRAQVAKARRVLNAAKLTKGKARIVACATPYPGKRHSIKKSAMSPRSPHYGPLGMIDLPSLNIKGITPKSILPAKVGKRKILCCNEVPCKLSWKVAPRKALRQNKIHLPDGKAAVGRILEGSKSLEQAMVNLQPHERRELTKNTHNASMVVPSKKSPSNVSSARRGSRENEAPPRSRDRHLRRPWTQETQKWEKPRDFSEERGEKLGKWLLARKKLGGLKRGKLVHHHHAPRVMITRKSRWESQRLFFPSHTNLTLFAHS